MIKNRPYAFEIILVDGIKSLDSNTYQPIMGEQVSEALITVEDNNIYFRLDGNNPSDGHRVFKNSIIYLETYEEISGFRVINEGMLDSKLKVSYFSNKALNA